MRPQTTDRGKSGFVKAEVSKVVGSKEFPNTLVDYGVCKIIVVSARRTGDFGNDMWLILIGQVKTPVLTMCTFNDCKRQHSRCCPIRLPR
jgi:hypothetical protein